MMEFAAEILIDALYRNWPWLREQWGEEKAMPAEPFEKALAAVFVYLTFQLEQHPEREWREARP